MTDSPDNGSVRYSVKELVEQIRDDIRAGRADVLQLREATEQRMRPLEIAAAERPRLISEFRQVQKDVDLLQAAAAKYDAALEALRDIRADMQILKDDRVSREAVARDRRWLVGTVVVTVINLGLGVVGLLR